MDEMATGVLSEARLRRSSTAEQVAEIVREAILAGELPPGTPLREGALAASLAISRHTFREAMRLLAAEGLVRHQLHRGVVVTQLSDDEVHDLFRARRMLELAAIDALRTDPAPSLERLGAIVDALEQAAAREDWRALAKQDLAFHREIVAAIGSRRIDSTYAAIQRELRLALANADRAPQIDEHRAMLDLAVAGHWDDLRATLERHLIDAETLVAGPVQRNG
jgi:DNA-binding GntR family transcriptional regulator